jgi:DNA adenine methylase
MSKPNPKPFLRWAGSKKKLLPELQKYFSSDFNKYIEPFVGSGQLFFKLPIKKAVLGDTNFGLISTYKNIQQNPQCIGDYLTGFSKNKEEYYKVRSEYNEQSDSIYNSALFIYLNTYCFNGLYRTNLSGKFNVPFAESSGKLINHSNLNEISEYLKKAVFVFGDFEKVVLDNCSEGDFVYLDPPYAVKNRRIFNQYGPETFGLNDIERLKCVIKEVDTRKASFVLSYAYCDEAMEISKNWNFTIVSTIRNISGFAQHRKVEKEIIITNID